MSEVTHVVFRPREDEEMMAALRTLRRVVMSHPVAAQAMFSALVQEGRRYGETAEGAVWLSRLEGTPLIERVRGVWDSLTQRSLEADPDVVLPTAIMEALVRAAVHPGAEESFQQVLEDVVEGRW